MHTLVFPSDRYVVIGGCVPIARCGGVETSAGFLNNGIRDNVFKRPIFLDQEAEDRFTNFIAPSVHLGVLIGIARNYLFKHLHGGVLDSLLIKHCIHNAKHTNNQT